ncbi:MAG: hypothetical protein KDK36_07030 [Leptospiraceae bacterium]|nr:hypothetical protein [Leptospiraceae bacterium]
MKKLVIIILISLFAIHLSSKEEPYSIHDKKISILYICDINGNFDFSTDGREGLATVSELKRQESEKIFSQKGGVLLLSRGNFFNSKNGDISFGLMKKAKFDAVFVNDSELEFLEKNPALLKIEPPVIAERENLLNLDTEKKVNLSGINFKISSYLINKLPIHAKEKIHLNLVFPDPNNIQDLSSIKSEIPVIFFLPEEKSSAYSFVKNVYTAECPSSKGVVGKIELTFRKEELIRQSQEFIPLNTEDTNRDWISPDGEVLKELQRN